MTQGSSRSRLIVAAALVLISAPIVVSAGCSSEPAASTSAAPEASPTASPQAGPPVSPEASPTDAGPATLDIAARLLVVRRQDGAWRLLRLTPATGAEETLATLPFRPSQALASPSRERVLYLNERRGLAVVEVETGAVTRISLAGLPIRSIDGATWTSAQRLLFGGSRRAYPSPEYSALYQVDVPSGTVASFRGLKGGEPSYATDEGSLVYVTRRTVGEEARETIWRLRSLSARPRSFASATAYVDAGRLFNTPLLSPDGAWLLGPRTGTDVSVTYRLYDVRFSRPFLTSYGGSPMFAAWGGGRLAFLQSRPGQARVAVYLYDTDDGSLTALTVPPTVIVDFDWSPQGDLAGWSPSGTQSDGAVHVSAASSLGEWVELGAGLVPVWVE